MQKHIQQVRHTFRKGTQARLVLIMSLVLLFGVEIGAFMRDVREAREIKAMHAEYGVPHRLDVINPNIEEVDAWMTFEYINIVFRLPENYLKDELAITDEKYPRIPIGGYARRHDIDRAALLVRIKTLIAATRITP